MNKIENGFMIWNTNEKKEFFFCYDDLFINFPNDEDITGFHCHIVDEKTMIHDVLKIDKYNIIRHKRNGLGDIIYIKAEIEPNKLIIPFSFTIETEKQHYKIIECVNL